MAQLPFHAPLLRAVAERMRILSVMSLARQAGVTGVWRVTVHYFDGRAPDAAATLIKRTGEEAILDLRYEHRFDRPLVLPISVQRYDLFMKGMIGLRFDQTEDQPNLPVYDSTDLWLVERAAGAFVHSLILAPALAGAAWHATGRDSWARLTTVIQKTLPEAVQPTPLS